MSIPSITKAAIRNLYLQEGSTFSEVIRLIQPPYPTGIPVDLTGYTAIATIRQTYKSSKVIATLNTLVDPTGGTITLSLPSSYWKGTSKLLKSNVLRSDISDDFATALVSTLPGKPYVWDLLVSSTSGEDYRIIEGGVLISDGHVRNP